MMIPLPSDTHIHHPDGKTQWQRGGSLLMGMHEERMARLARMGMSRPVVVYCPPEAPPPIVFGAPVNLYRQPGWRHIVQLVALKYGVMFEDVVGETRQHYIVAARHHAMFLVFTHTNWSWARVAACFNRDHTTVIHGCRSHARQSAEMRATLRCAVKARKLRC